MKHPQTIFPTEVYKKAIPEIVEWDILNWAIALKFWSKFLPQNSDEAKVLAIGERNGGLTLWLALQSFQVICSDRWLGPTPYAHTLHEKYGVSSSVSYQEIDVFDIPYPDNHFDIVICKSTIGGLKLDYNNRSSRTLDNQQRACEEVRRVLKPGGVFLCAENLKGSRLHHWWRERKQKTIGWRYLTLDEVVNIFQCYSILNKDSFGFLPTRSKSKNLNRLFFFFNKVAHFLLPKTMFYICFIAARK